MPKFIPYDYSQSSMVVINYQDQLRPGTFEHAIHYLIDKRLDLTVFYPNFKNDETGRPAYDPAILLKIILYAYSKRITSSREIEWCCQTNIIFKALSCDSVPHYTTIADFVSSHPTEIESICEQILLICDEQGLLGHELFAIDGCKMPSNAAKEWSGTFEELERKREKINHGKRHQDSKTESVSLFPPTAFHFSPENSTCTCPAGEQLVLRREAKDGSGNQKVFFEGRLLQCRHCELKSNCMRNPKSADHRKGKGRQVSFIQEKGGKPPNYTDWMKLRVDSCKGKQIYGHRMSVVEPVFGNIGANKRLSRFSLRGKQKVQGQWQLYCLLHNIEKIANYGNMLH